MPQLQVILSRLLVPASRSRRSASVLGQSRARREVQWSAPATVRIPSSVHNNRHPYQTWALFPEIFCGTRQHCCTGGPTPFGSVTRGNQSRWESITGWPLWSPACHAGRTLASGCAPALGHSSAQSGSSTPTEGCTLPRLLTASDDGRARRRRTPAS